MLKYISCKLVVVLVTKNDVNINFSCDRNTNINDIEF